MLCKITCTGDVKSQEIQMLKGIRAVATAAAGSTPSVICSTLTNQNNNNNYEIITVLDNTTAGGWTVLDDGTNLQPDATEGASGSYQQFLQLYSTTGKSAKPYVWIKLITSTGSSSATQPYGIMPIVGFSQTTAACGTEARAAPSTVNSSGYAAILLSSEFATTADYNGALKFTNTVTREYYVSCNSEHIHVQQGALGNQSCGSFLHFGTRTNNSWEDNYDDNPYWVAIAGAQGQDGYNGSAQSYFTRMRFLQTTTGAVDGSATKLSRAIITAAGNFTAPVFNNTLTYSNIQYTQNPGNPGNIGVPHPTNMELFSSAFTTSGQSNGTFNYFAQSGTGLEPMMIPSSPSIAVNNSGVTSDPISGALIIPALPVMIRAGNGLNNGGYMKNLFQSNPFSTVAQLDLYHTIDTPVNINGESFFGIRHGYGNQQMRALLFVKTS
jgi:hypothetical protein